MTDNTILADKVQELIDHMGRVVTKAEDRALPGSEAEVTAHWKRRLEALLPKPPTLADELRAFEDRGHWDSELLDSFADRVETLEQERDAAQAEIARLRAREIPNGWRVAEHPKYGMVLADERPDEDGDVHYARLGKGPYDLIHCGWGSPAELSFRDEAPAPQPEVEHIDPTTCGRFRPCLVEVNGKGERVMIRHDDDNEPWVDVSDLSFWKDDELTVLRRLTPEEMDER